MLSAGQSRQRVFPASGLNMPSAQGWQEKPVPPSSATYLVHWQGANKIEETVPRHRKGPEQWLRFCSTSYLRFLHNALVPCQTHGFSRLQFHRNGLHCGGGTHPIPPGHAPCSQLGPPKNCRQVHVPLPLAGTWNNFITILGYF